MFIALLLLVSLFIVYGRSECSKGWFSVNVNGTGVPRCCQACPEGANVVDVCTANKTTRCNPCQIGEHIHPATLICVPCTECPEGHEVISNCVLKKDTKCLPCPPGTFSNTSSYNHRCQKCTSCPEGFFEAQNCSGVRDTVCNRTTTTSTVAFDQSTTPPYIATATSRSTNKSPEKRKQSIWNILIGILVVIFVALIIAIIVLCYCKRVLCFERDVASGHRRQSSRRGLIKTQTTHQAVKGDPEEGTSL